jgi:protein-S-isoprenylcysteine O-methyltransferase Ste14
VLTTYIRAFIVVTALIFLTGMQFGFTSGPGRNPLRLLLLVSIVSSVSTAVVLGWDVTYESPWCVVIGTLLTSAGIILFLVALVSHPSRPGKAFASEPPPSLLCRGPYRLARHPLYLSYLLALVGIATLTASWLMFAMSCWMAALYWYAAAMEERLILASDIGSAYTTYRRRVGMFWPWSVQAHKRRDSAGSDVSER